jgi:hypothetical protein
MPTTLVVPSVPGQLHWHRGDPHREHLPKDWEEDSLGRLGSEPMWPTEWPSHKAPKSHYTSMEEMLPSVFPQEEGDKPQGFLTSCDAEDIIQGLTYARQMLCHMESNATIYKAQCWLVARGSCAAHFWYLLQTKRKTNLSGIVPQNVIVIWGHPRLHHILRLCLQGLAWQQFQIRWNNYTTILRSDSGYLLCGVNLWLFYCLVKRLFSNNSLRFLIALALTGVLIWTLHGCPILRASQNTSLCCQMTLELAAALSSTCTILPGPPTSSLCM